MGKKHLKLSILIITALTIITVLIKFAPEIINMSQNPQSIREYINQFGSASYLVFIMLQILQVIIAIIPGDFFHIAGGFNYGIPLGFLLSFIGLMAGTIIAFYISRLLGYRFIRKFISEEKISKMSKLINTSKGMIGIFIICLIPAIPKDILIYVAGLTPIKASRLFTVYFVSRIPNLLVLVSIGANTFEKDFSGIIITIVILICLIAIGFILKHKLKNKYFKEEN